MSAKKGSNFERRICKKLSLWWTYGKRDDVFWRSSQSGGRATQRQKKGLKTYGSYGDIAAVDPIGKPLLDIFTIELKCGQYQGCPGDLLDRKKRPFVKALVQARDAHVRAESQTWLLISHSDRRETTVFFPSELLHDDFPLYPARKDLLKPCVFRYRIKDFDFMGMTLDKFLSSVDPGNLGAPYP